MWTTQKYGRVQKTHKLTSATVVLSSWYFDAVFDLVSVPLKIKKKEKERKHQRCSKIPGHLTNGKGLLGLGAVLVVPGWAASGVDGSFGGAQERRLGLALAGGPFPGWTAGAHCWEKPVQRSLTGSTAKQQTHSRAWGHLWEWRNFLLPMKACAPVSRCYFKTVVPLYQHTHFIKQPIAIWLLV